MAAAHDHHDHSNCSHDHGEPKKTNVVSDEMTLRKQAAEKLTKVNEKKKKYKEISFFYLTMLLVFSRITRNR